MKSNYDIVVLGLSITSSWGNGHATTYRSLLKEFNARGHNVLFLERDVPWYRSNRDMPIPDFCELELYRNVEQLKSQYSERIAQADFVIVGSYVPEGVEIGRWVTETACATAFYDIDTPITLEKLRKGDYEYLTPDLISRYDMYLSFTGGPTLDFIESFYGSPAARALYCSVDPHIYYPEECKTVDDLGYLGTYSDDRQPKLEKLLIHPAKNNPDLRFVVAGPQYPETVKWPGNISRIDHLPPARHRRFYNSQRFTLNLTRDRMTEAGFSPSVRLFEAAACGTCIISDYWEGIETILEPGQEILLAENSVQVQNWLRNLPDDERISIGRRARQKILRSHSAAKRAYELETYIAEVLSKTSYAPRTIRTGA